MNSDIWFPVLEHNQGTLSLAALVLALGLALFEQHRANRGWKWRERSLRRLHARVASLIKRVENEPFETNNVAIIFTELSMLSVAYAAEPEISAKLKLLSQSAAQYAERKDEGAREELVSSLRDLHLRLAPLILSLRHGS